MSQRHTPGPWWVEADETGGPFAKRIVSASPAEDGEHTLAESVHPNDASLIAEAPQLFEAWESFLSAQRTIDDGAFMDNYRDVARARKRQADSIARAIASIARILGGP